MPEPGLILELFGVPPARDPLINDLDAYCTLGACAISAVCALSVFSGLAKQAFPDHFTPSDSPLYYLLLRCRVLVVADALLMLNCIASFAHYYTCWAYRTSISFPIFQAIWGITFPALGALIAIASCQRCALIVTQRPRARALFSRGVVIAAILLSGTATLNALTILLSALGPCHPPRSAKEWYDLHFYSPPVVFLAALFPLGCMGGSIWALHANLGGPQTGAHVIRPVMSASHTTAAALSSRWPSIVSVSHVVGNPNKESDDKVARSPSALQAKSDKLQVDASLLQVPGSSATLAGSPSGSISIPGPRATTIPTVATVQDKALSPRRSLISPSLRSSNASRISRRGTLTASSTYPLSRPFMLLTVLVMVEWILFLIVNSGIDLGCVIEPIALSLLLSACAIVTEMSFERMARVMQRSDGEVRRGTREDQTFDMGSAGSDVGGGGRGVGVEPGVA
ncbi:hypothetical protein BC828DRAFT_403031 [Blastocladiella britannica]|nr:hypothetical protein BC828DRAFT_403031 [Blastocladiella britannica]